MKAIRIAGTQSRLFDELPSGQKLLFNVVAPDKAKAAATESSLLESIADELVERKAVPLANQSKLF